MDAAFEYYNILERLIFILRSHCLWSTVGKTYKFKILPVAGFCQFAYLLRVTQIVDLFIFSLSQETWLEEDVVEKNMALKHGAMYLGNGESKRRKPDFFRFCSLRADNPLPYANCIT